MKQEGLCWSELGFVAQNKLKAKVIEQKISEVQKAQTEPQQTGVLVQKGRNLPINVFTSSVISTTLVAIEDMSKATLPVNGNE